MATRNPEQYRRLLVRLRQARLDCGLQQTDVATALGEPQQFVSRVELGERRIDPTELQEFAKLYKKPLAHFLD